MGKEGYNEANLLKALLSAENLKVFWKDRERRFVGANKSFLDYYGFASENVILGKTDENMGWHVDPVPYRNDENRVLHEGKVISQSRGTCIIRGELRIIEATKMPIYDDDNNIVGLVGYFMDITDNDMEIERFRTVSYTDELTGIPNRNAFYDEVQKYVSSFDKYETDFVMLYINIDNMDNAVDDFGREFGHRMLRSVSEELQNMLGNDSLIFSFGGSEFVILHQVPDDDIASLSDSAWTIEEKVRSLLTSVHIYEDHSYCPGVSIGFSSYSGTKSIEKMLVSAQKDMHHERKYNN
ncbi:MAG: GGDEF domain-containing protein [Lachnospiraceae bacterium]|nr:GGDEF domain-containing protein [Lachnospiraceae bacterium]